MDKNATKYKFAYNDASRLVGCGRSFKHTILDELNWQVFPLNLNSGIDGASKELIKGNAIPLNSNNIDCFTFSFKEETDMITPMSNLLKSNQCKYEIVSQNNYMQILHANSLRDLEMSFKLKKDMVIMKDYLFITLLDDDLKKANPVMLNSYYMKPVLMPHFDVIDLRDLEFRKDFDYKLIFIDGIALNTRTSQLNSVILKKYMLKIWLGSASQFCNKKYELYDMI